MTNNSPAQRLLESIYKILLEEVSAYDYLDETIRKKQKAIVKNNLKEIEHLTGIEQVVVERANSLTQKRHDLMQQYFMSDQIVTEPLSLNNLIHQVEGTERAAWQRMNRRLNKAVTSIQQMNAENQRLIESSLAFVRGNIHLFIPRDNLSSDMYSKDGNDSQKIKVKNLLDCNA